MSSKHKTIKESTIDEPRVKRPRLTLDKNEKEEFERHHRELDELIEQCSSKLNEIAELECTQRFAKAANIKVPSYLKGGYGCEFREKLVRFSKDLNSMKSDFLRDYKRLNEIETTTICNRCSCQTLNDLQECKCLRERRQSDFRINVCQGIRLCKACINYVETSSSAIAYVCCVCAAVGCRKDWKEGCGTKFGYALLDNMSAHQTYMCPSCESSYVVGSCSLTTAVFSVAKHRHSHKHDIARDHGGYLAKLDDNILHTMFGYFNAATLCQFSQTNYTNFCLVKPVAKKLVEQARARNLIHPQRVFRDVGISTRTLHRFEGDTASQFGFDFVDDMAGAAIFSRRENKACFTDRFNRQTLQGRGGATVHVYDNYIYGEAEHVNAYIETSAICGNLPLSSNSGDYFLIATLQGMTDVGPFSFELVPSDDCCSEELATSPDDVWCANFTLTLSGGRAPKVVLGMKFDSKANRLTYIYLCCETCYGDVSMFERFLPTMSVVQDTIDVVNPSNTEPLLWALRFEGSDPHLVAVREASRDEFLQLQQKIKSYPG